MGDLQPNRPGKPLTAYGRAVRQARIFTKLRDGLAHHDIARLEGLSTRRVREIVADALKRRPVADRETHLRLQIERLTPALQAASLALDKGDAKAIRPLIKVLDRLDQYHALILEPGGREDSALRRIDGVDRLARGKAPDFSVVRPQPSENTSSPTQDGGQWRTLAVDPP